VGRVAGNETQRTRSAERWCPGNTEHKGRGETRSEATATLSTNRQLLSAQVMESLSPGIWIPAPERKLPFEHVAATNDTKDDTQGNTRRPGVDDANANKRGRRRGDNGAGERRSGGGGVESVVQRGRGATADEWDGDAGKDLIHPRRSQN
jgi:hypothetical protein